MSRLWGVLRPGSGGGFIQGGTGEKGCDAGMLWQKLRKKAISQFQKQMLWSLPGHGQYLHLLWSNMRFSLLFEIFHLLQSRGHKGKGKGVSNHQTCLHIIRENKNGAHLDLIIIRQLTLRREHWYSRNFFYLYAQCRILSSNLKATLKNSLIIIQGRSGCNRCHLIQTVPLEHFITISWVSSFPIGHCFEKKQAGKK